MPSVTANLYLWGGFGAIQVKKWSKSLKASVCVRNQFWRWLLWCCKQWSYSCQRSQLLKMPVRPDDDDSGRCHISTCQGMAGATLSIWCAFSRLTSNLQSSRVRCCYYLHCLNEETEAPESRNHMVSKWQSWDLNSGDSDAGLRALMS